LYIIVTGKLKVKFIRFPFLSQKLKSIYIFLTWKHQQAKTRKQSLPAEIYALMTWLTVMTPIVYTKQFFRKVLNNDFCRSVGNASKILNVWISKQIL